MYFHEKKMLNSKNCNFSRQIAILNILHDNEIFFWSGQDSFWEMKMQCPFFQGFFMFEYYMRLCNRTKEVLCASCLLQKSQGWFRDGIFFSFGGTVPQ